MRTGRILCTLCLDRSAWMTAFSRGAIERGTLTPHNQLSVQGVSARACVCVCVFACAHVCVAVCVCVQVDTEILSSGPLDVSACERSIERLQDQIRQREPTVAGTEGNDVAATAATPQQTALMQVWRAEWRMNSHNALTSHSTHACKRQELQGLAAHEARVRYTRGMQVAGRRCINAGLHCSADTDSCSIPARGVRSHSGAGVHVTHV